MVALQAGLSVNNDNGRSVLMSAVQVVVPVLASSLLRAVLVVVTVLASSVPALVSTVVTVDSVRPPGCFKVN